MRILLIMDPLIPVPPRHYGGIERVVADLANELVRRGQQHTQCSLLLGERHKPCRNLVSG
jgi:glycosyltransferase involved in cell wall biosynthesis